MRPIPLFILAENYEMFRWRVRDLPEEFAGRVNPVYLRDSTQLRGRSSDTLIWWDGSLLKGRRRDIFDVIRERGMKIMSLNQVTDVVRSMLTPAPKDLAREDRLKLLMEIAMRRSEK